MSRAIRWAAVFLAAVIVTAGVSGLERSGLQAMLQVSSPFAGQTASHRLTFDVAAGTPEIHRAAIDYPAGFRFNGFLALGPAGTVVGTYELDLTFDGVPERRMFVRSLGADSAYIDLVADGRFAPGVEPVIRHSSLGTLHVRLPFGGDANAATLVAPFGARVTLALDAGLLVNPAIGGTYDVIAGLTTVDPDTGDESDGAGAPPETSRLVLPVRIKGPSNAKFADLAVQKFDLTRTPHGRYRFAIHGRFVLSRSGDGVDLGSENTTVVLDWFRQTIPASAFTRVGHAYHYRGAGPGIERFVVWPDGRFQIEARELALIAPQSITYFTLRIGNDRGTVVIADGKRRDR